MVTIRMAKAEFGPGEGPHTFVFHIDDSADDAAIGSVTVQVKGDPARLDLVGWGAHHGLVRILEAALEAAQELADRKNDA